MMMQPKGWAGMLDGCRGQIEHRYLVQRGLGSSGRFSELMIAGGGFEDAPRNIARGEGTLRSLPPPSVLPDRQRTITAGYERIFCNTETAA